MGIKIREKKRLAQNWLTFLPYFSQPGVQMQRRKSGNNNKKVRIKIKKA
jgi:hypothetical protein